MAPQIVWKEGMALSPHHLQQHNQWVLETCHSMGFKQGLSQGGYVQLSFLESSLTSGMLAFEKLHAYFFSGECYQEGQNHSLSVEPRSFTPYWNAEKESLMVYLGLPVSKKNFAYFSKPCADYLEPNHEKDIAFMAAVPKILFEGESLDGFDLLPLAHLIRTPQGVVALDPLFVPPVMHIHAYTPLKALLGNIQKDILAKIQRLASVKPTPQGNSVGPFLFLQNLYSFSFVLESLLQTPHTEAYAVYLECVRFLGSMQAHFQERMAIPPWQPMQLGEVFHKIRSVFKGIMELEQSSPYSGRRLEREGQTAFTCNIEGLGLELASGKNVYLTVDSPLSAEELCRSFVVQAKVAPKSKLQAIIVSAMEGIICEPCMAPEGIQNHTETHFFRLNQNQSLWNDLIQESKLGVYAPMPLQVKGIGILVENHS